jgi:hypothetical protein
MLVVWYVDSADSGHACPRSKKFAILASNLLIHNYKFCPRPGSTLTLLVAWILANDAHHALAADDLAVAAHPLYRCHYFHLEILSWQLAVGSWQH